MYPPLSFWLSLFHGNPLMSAEAKLAQAITGVGKNALYQLALRLQAPVVGESSTIDREASE